MSVDMTECVREFMRHARQRLPRQAIHPAASIVSLRLRLLDEESEEASDALADLAQLDVGTSELAAATKELIDVIYVALGGILALGVDPDAAFRAVHASNMTKDGPDTPAGKMTKGPSYQAPDMLAVIAGGAE